MTGYTGVIGLPKYGQSPINIDDTVVRPMKYPPLILNGHWMNEGEASLTNTGYTAKVNLSGDRIPSTIYGGPLQNDEYELNHVEFHWGKEDCNGAEHTLNGTWFSMEAQCIHWNRKYLNFKECMQYHDGLCVLSYFFLVRDDTRRYNNVSYFDKISDYVDRIIVQGSEVKIPPSEKYSESFHNQCHLVLDALCWMRQAINCSGYYTYQGSTTYSPFSECVTWIIFPLVIPVRKCQVEVFRHLKDSNGRSIANNCRPQQFLRGRKIYWADNPAVDY